MSEIRGPEASQILAVLDEIGPASWGELVSHLGVGKGKGGNKLRRVLNRLLEDGQIVREGRSKYRLNNLSDQSGVVNRIGSQLFVSSRESGSTELRGVSGIREGDTVRTRLSGGVARVVELIKPSSIPVVGIYHRDRRPAPVESLEPGYNQHIELVAPYPGCRAGDVVEVQILDVERGRVRGKVKTVIRHKNEVQRACRAMVHAHRIPSEWPGEVVQTRIRKALLEADRKGRKDLRDTAFVTIDGEDARDFDDAIYAEPRSRGGWRLLVAIADVAHYVRPGSALDQEAFERGNSVYFPDRVIPMLPESLSNDLCSLRPNEDRLAMVCELTLTSSANVTDVSFYEAVIRSHGRLTYTELDQYLKSAEAKWTAKICASLQHLYAVYRGWRERRADRGALDFDSHEGRVETHEGKAVRVTRVVSTEAHGIVEEAMIVANVAAAKYLQSRKSGAMYRVHEPPEQAKIEQLRNIFQSVGQRFNGAIRYPRDLQRVLSATHKTRIEPWIWQMLILRTLQQARYSPDDKGHFGLALSSYAHFTSPIRRYADLVNHRLIKARLGKARSGTPGYEALADVGTHISMTERRAENATRSVDAWLKCALVEERVGGAFGGTIVTVTEFGVFVELDDLCILGLLHVARLGSDYYKWVPNTMSLVADRSGHRFTIGQKIRVVIEEVAVEFGRINLRSETPSRKRKIGRPRRKKAL